MARLKQPGEPRNQSQSRPQHEQQEKYKYEKQRKKEPVSKTILRVLIYMSIIAILFFVVLFLISRAALYDSIGSMLQHMWGELQLMGERIRNR